MTRTLKAVDLGACGAQPTRAAAGAVTVIKRTPMARATAPQRNVGAVNGAAAADTTALAYRRAGIAAGVCSSSC